MTHTCETCRYYDGTISACKRRSPLPGENPIFPRWPMVRLNDWCGDHQLSQAADIAARKAIDEILKKP